MDSLSFMVHLVLLYSPEMTNEGVTVRGGGVEFVSCAFLQ